MHVALPTTGSPLVIREELLGGLKHLRNESVFIRRNGFDVWGVVKPGGLGHDTPERAARSRRNAVDVLGRPTTVDGRTDRLPSGEKLLPQQGLLETGTQIARQFLEHCRPRLLCDGWIGRQFAAAGQSLSPLETVRESTPQEVEDV